MIPASDVAACVYHKTTDRKGEDGEAIALPPEQHRVRAEFTLQGAALKKYGLDDPLSLNRFDTKAIIELFHFRLILPPEDRLRKTKLHKDTIKAAAEGKSNAVFLNGLERIVLKERAKGPQCHISSWSHGLEAFDPNAKGGRAPRKHSIHTVPHEELNEMAHKGLKKLFKRLGRDVSL